MQSEAFQTKLQENTYLIVDTSQISKAERLCLAELLRQSDAVRYLEETKILAEFNKITTTKDGSIAIENARYKTRIRPCEKRIVVFADKDVNKLNTGQVHRMTGRTSFVSSITGGSISKVSTVTVANVDFTGDILNDSQREMMSAMLGESPVTVVHGPPSTGKTTAITKAAQLWEKSRSPVWIAAQSNVAVKNIAEKLFKKCVNFKIIVSNEFYFEW
ncbi:hypothetical protein M422DRAFT_40882 [Sphaerobolus stellatus SS14]|nr:hypothetical protein M422DRAFT_40882 [Sphaerobolus stellatus SS14]